MQIDDPLRTCSLVQPIHVLRYQERTVAGLFQACQRSVRRIRLCFAYRRPPRIAARPVALARSRLVDKITVLDGVVALPLTAAVAVGWDTRGEAYAGACKDNGARIGEQKFTQRRGGILNHRGVSQSICAASDSLPATQV